MMMEMLRALVGELEAHLKAGRVKAALDVVRKMRGILVLG